MKPVGKPDAVVPPVRFDERRLETEPRRELRYRHRRKPSMTVHLAARGHRASRRLYSRSIATRCWKARCGSGYERLSGRCAENWASRSYPAFCRENMSICSWKSRRILLSATSCGASRGGRRIGCRWSSRTCASATGGGISGLGATSPPRAATSRTMSYFSIFRSTNLPASAGSYSVIESRRWLRLFLKNPINTCGVVVCGHPIIAVGAWSAHRSGLVCVSHR